MRNHGRHKDDHSSGVVRVPDRAVMGAADAGPVEYKLTL
jgi:hypothetical protein